MHTKVRKAIIPAAGIGTRMLSATKSVPMELLPIVDRPILDYIVAEAFASGIEHVVIVTGRMKGAIEDDFDHAFEIDTCLRNAGKHGLADRMAEARLPREAFPSFASSRPATWALRYGRRVRLSVTSPLPYCSLTC